MKTQKIDTATVESTAAAIMRYLHALPDSADTVEGVAEWWLARQRVKDTMEIVSGALELLIADGSVQKYQNADGRVIYTLHHNAADS